MGFTAGSKGKIQGNLPFITEDNDDNKMNHYEEVPAEMNTHTTIEQRGYATRF
jgi:hypothetical protein